ncbi:Slp family lipoprotein [Acidithiobacillus sp.]|uniref:Slp family lipoprotein n=1 Tax=Acidithiobacillus sp. TaxID=1872118 RepID=UPI0025B842C3|nr:Slp family lipoprotein [Acidithiobacillus sp.]
MHARLKFLVLPPAVLASLALSACSALTPVAGRYPSITPQEAQTAATSTQVLRWGGTIIGSSKVSGETCLTVLSYPLDRLGKPQIGGDTGDSGRFIACTSAALDPVRYRKGRQITVIGYLRGIRIQMIGEHPYRYPLLQASTLYLWPRPQHNRMDHTFIQNRCSPLFTSIGCSSSW